MFCLCLAGFSGSSCETDDSQVCYVGNGAHYRGPVSQTWSQRQCLEWDSINKRAFVADSASLGLGQHNRCRNPDNSRMPWCFVQRRSRVVKEYCNIPHCHTQPALSSTVLPFVIDPDSDWHCGNASEQQFKIVGGSLSTVERHPWMAAVFWKSSSQRSVFHCAGSLIAPCWVLTAAHCFPDGAGTNLKKLQVALGKSALNETDARTEQTFRVTQLYTHERFDNKDGSYDNDIALLKISSLKGVCAVETNSVRTVCLPPPHVSLPDGTSCQIAGYGKEQEGLWYNSQYLREGNVNLLPQDTCSSKNYYGNMITDNMLCAGLPDWSVDACKGDSGGPLVCNVDGQAFLFGVVSWGEGCSREHRPGVYSRVMKYNHWILQKTKLIPEKENSLYLQE
ncbi:plasminogen activator, urokinase b isoform X2 [Brachyhypopomus gauderio]